MIRAIAAAMLALALVVPAQAEPSARDWDEIKRTIAAQREAIVAGDGERAFDFATPPLRARYGDAATFMRMVRQGYRPLIEARHVEFLEGAVIAGDVVQPLRLVMADGTVLVAIYGVQQQSDGSWRISACVIAPSTVRSARLGQRPASDFASASHAAGSPPEERSSRKREPVAAARSRSPGPPLA
jgi:hypothetical protein